MFLKEKNLLIYLLLLLVVFSFSFCWSQGTSYLNPAISMLDIPIDAKAIGGGATGVATKPDVFSQYWNAAKYNFVEESKAIGIGYIPYINSSTENDNYSLNSDAYLFSIVGFSEVNKSSFLGSSFRYFSYSKIKHKTQIDDVLQGEDKPYEFAFDVSYSLKISNKVSMGITGRYIHSNLKTQLNPNAITINTFSSDISAYYQSNSIEKNRWSAGITLSNIGPKVSYTLTSQEHFIPTKLATAIAYLWIPNINHKVETNIEFSKLLIPTPPITKRIDTNNNGIIDSKDNFQIEKGMPTNVNFFNGIIQSFYDAPGGFNEEISEITSKLGITYIYNNSLRIKTGLLYQDPNKGSQKFITLGLGYQKYGFGVDFSYIQSFSVVRNPMQGAIQFSVFITPSISNLLQYKEKRTETLKEKEEGNQWSEETEEEEIFQ